MMQKSNNFEKVSNLADLPSCAPFTKNKEGAEKFMQTENTDKVLRDKAFEIASNLKYDGYQKGLASMVYKIFGKNSSGRAIKLEPN